MDILAKELPNEWCSKRLTMYSHNKDNILEKLKVIIIITVLSEGFEKGRQKGISALDKRGSGGTPR